MLDVLRSDELAVSLAASPQPAGAPVVPNEFFELVVSLRNRMCKLHTAHSRMWCPTLADSLLFSSSVNSPSRPPLARLPYPRQSLDLGISPLLIRSFPSRRAAGPGCSPSPAGRVLDGPLRPLAFHSRRSPLDDAPNPASPWARGNRRSRFPRRCARGRSGPVSSGRRGAR